MAEYRKKLTEMALSLDVNKTPTDGLLVRRADLREALQIVSHVMGKRAGGAALRFEDGWLFISAGDAVAKAPARGFWPVTIIVGPSFVRRLVRCLPPGDPVFLHPENGRLYVNSYSEPCQWSIKEPVYPSVDTRIQTRRISEAAVALKPLLVNREDIESLVKEVSTRGTPMWRKEEQPLISAVARAWEFLAPLGVETSDLRKVVDAAVRNAWKENGKLK